MATRTFTSAAFNATAGLKGVNFNTLTGTYLPVVDAVAAKTSATPSA